VSAAPGDTVSFHIGTNPAANYRIDVYRLGWYGAAGARLETCLPSCTSDEPGSVRPVPAPNPTTGEIDAGWPVTDSVTVPSSWVSGYYMAKLVLTSGAQAGSAGSIYFIVREAPTRHAAILVEAPVNTWEAYNNWGGKSLYADGSTGAPAVKVSFNRPGIGQDAVMNWEYPAVRFFEREGMDVSYTTSYDLQADPSSLLNHKLIVSLGHDEYWTMGMRTALQNARDNGVNVAFLGGNTMYWQARYEDSGRTLVEYRDATLDPETDPTLKTVRWRDLATPLPECQLVGIQDLGGIRAPTDPPRDYSLVSSALGDPWLANTEFAAGATLGDAVGYEWDGIQTGCSVPPETPLFHYGGLPANADAVRYTAPSGAMVLAVGSVQFSWLLDGWRGHDAPPDPRAQQFVRNAFAAMTR
jgi:N,N-dimethylformamidase beta subunit-like protein